ncbi:MAG: restriction endonuclease subunit S [Candidatus Poribacteria bacterium]|nr:restriction endonuclease subunit S [Candidatus Poribacteria bacterium]
MEIRTYSESGYRYLRVSDLGQHGIENHNPRYVDIEEIPNKIKLTNNSFLISRSGSLGLVSVVEDEVKEAILSSHIFKVSLNTTKIRPEYLEALLRSQIGQFQFFQNNNGAVIPEISQIALKSIRVVLPPLNIQNHIVSFMRSAHAHKKEKEQEADVLLASIDDYVLTELGIEMPQQKENSIDSRIFTTTSSEVFGGRFDPEVYHQVYSLHTETYPMEKFQNCVLINPTTSFYGYELDTSITFVPMEKVSAKYGEADLSLCKAIEEAKGYTRFRDNDLIWAKITPCMENGKSAIVDSLKGGIGCGSTEFHVFRALEEINIHYIHALLRLKSLRKHAALHFTGSAGQQRVSSEFFKELIIPKPSIEKQAEIADYITNTRNRVKQLQQEANAIVGQAKERVEQILLAEG